MGKQSISIKQLSLADRPREKLIQKGRQSLTDSELLAIILGTGNKNDSVLGLAQKILTQANHDLSTLAKMSVNDLKKINGIAEAKAVNIIAALELGRRRKELNQPELLIINSSRDVFEEVEVKYRDLQHEEFWVIYLNRANKIIHKQCLSIGGVSGTVADVRIILKYALEHLASGIILTHNHPSGNLRPSEEDIRLTSKCKTACEFYDIKLLDHLIIYDSKYYSFTENGLI